MLNNTNIGIWLDFAKGNKIKHIEHEDGTWILLSDLCEADTTSHIAGNIYCNGYERDGYIGADIGSAMIPDIDLRNWEIIEQSKEEL